MKGEGGIFMITGAVMNGLIIWIFNLINWFKRVCYRMNGAICIQGAYQIENSKRGSRLFSVNHEGKSILVKYCSQYRDPFDNYRNGDITTLYWIPGESNAMLFDYKTDKKSLDGLFVCDLASIIALIALIIILIVQNGISRIEAPAAYHATEVAVAVSFAIMIAAGLFRRFRLKR